MLGARRRAAAATRRTNFERLAGRRRAAPFAPSALDGAAVIVDAILGTGFAGSPRGSAAEAITAINEAQRGVVRDRLRCSKRRRRLHG